MLKRKNQWQISDIYSGRHRTFNIKIRRSFWQRNPKLGGLAKGGLTVMISVLMIYGIVQAGSLTPSASPAATMNSLADIAGSGFVTATHSLKALYDWLGTNVEGVKSALTGTYDASGVSSNASGNVMEQLKFIRENLGGYTYGSANASDVLTIAGGTYNATNLIVGNVRSGVAFGVGLTGTYGGEGWTYGSDDASKVLTSADAAGTYNASNLTVGVVKSGTTFATSSTGDYPSATYPLPSADGGVTDLAASGGNISSSNGSVEWWQSDGTRQTATLDFPTLSNLCSSDTSNNSEGTLSVTAAYISVGNTYCGTAGTLLANLFNGSLSAGGFDGGSQANGGVDDYNNAGSAASGRYAKGWTACTSGADNYCGTGDAFADMKDDSTGLIWSKPCSGVGCTTFAEPADTDYEWTYTDDADNDGKSASVLCSQTVAAGNHGSGWSLPHQKQLMQAYINGVYGNLEASGVNRPYWSATTRSDYTSYAWFTYLSHGFTNSFAKSGSYYVRCVRSAN
jgi:hypothetical protein